MASVKLMSDLGDAVTLTARADLARGANRSLDSDAIPLTRN